MVEQTSGGPASRARRFLRWLWRSSRLPALALLLLGGGAALAGWSGFSSFIDHTNTLGFCIGCHEMEQTVYQEYKGSVHGQNPSGVRAICSDCHVPKDFVPKMLRKLEAANEVYHALVGTVDTPEKFEARRAELAERVWARMRANDSAGCRSCHAFETMKLEAQRPRAQERHPEALRDGKTCIDCHRGVAHKLPLRDD